jgi:hypothetical protein
MNPQEFPLTEMHFIDQATGKVEVVRIDGE